jgi:hypothetical protein
MALTFPPQGRAGMLSPMQSAAVLAFLLFYVSLAGMRFEVGGDWQAYQNMYDLARQSSLLESMSFTDPVFGAMLWVSSRLGLGIYPVNAVCAGLMAVGVVRLSLSLREPWLAILAAVPYLLIVVGMGYVRQSGAMGVLMIAMAGLDGNRRLLTAAQLALAAGLHSSAGVVFPFFVLTLAGRNILMAGVLAVGVAYFAINMAQRISGFESGYVAAEYESSGALVRVLMSLLPSLLLLARWKHFKLQGLLRRMWLLLACANVLAMVALELSPSSTAVDRIALYFSPVQLVAYGSLADLVKLESRGTYIMRALMICLLGLIQVVWLVLAENAVYWVPYKSLVGLV